MELGTFGFQARQVPLDVGMEARAFAEQHAMRCSGSLQGRLAHSAWLLCSAWLVFGFMGIQLLWGSVCWHVPGIRMGPRSLQAAKT